MRMWNRVPHAYGRWAGRRCAIVASSHGIADLQARRLIADRALGLRGAALAGFWRGVTDIRPEWEVLRVGIADLD